MANLSDIFRMTSRERSGLLALVIVLTVIVGVLLSAKNCRSVAPGPIVEEKVEKDTLSTDSITVVGKTDKNTSKKRRRLRVSKSKHPGEKSRSSQRDPMSEPKLN